MEAFPTYIVLPRLINVPALSKPDNMLETLNLAVKTKLSYLHMEVRKRFVSDVEKTFPRLRKKIFSNTSAGAL